MGPKKLDTIQHEGSLYAFSIRNGKPAVLRGTEWLDLSDYKFVPVAGKKDTWETVHKDFKGKPKEEDVVQQGYVNFIVKVNVSGQTFEFKTKARDEKQVERKAWGAVSDKLNISIPAVRSRLLPDSITIKRA
jgi:hypothetical protein